MTIDPTYLNLLPLPTDFTEPTEDISVLLDALAGRIGALRKGGERDLEGAMTFMIRAFREGRLGRWTFDDLEGGAGTPRSSDLRGNASRAASSTGKVDDDLPVMLDSNIEYGQGETPTPHPASADLDEAVSQAVRSFLETSATTQARMAEGKDLSTSQQRKAASRAKNEARLARWKAKGIGGRLLVRSPRKRTGVR